MVKHQKQQKKITYYKCQRLSKTICTCILFQKYRWTNWENIFSIFNLTSKWQCHLYSTLAKSALDHIPASLFHHNFRIKNTWYLIIYWKCSNKVLSRTKENTCSSSMSRISFSWTINITFDKTNHVTCKNRWAFLKLSFILKNLKIIVIHNSLWKRTSQKCGDHTIITFNASNLSPFLIYQIVKKMLIIDALTISRTCKLNFFFKKIPLPSGQVHLYRK